MALSYRHPLPLLLILSLFYFDHPVSSMRLVLQRVKSASVTLENNQVVSHIGPGLLALVGLHEDDTRRDLETCCKQLLACKLWSNDDSGGLWRHGVKQKGFEVLLVSQFTLYGTLSKKNQPDYKRAMKAQAAQELYSEFVSMVETSYQVDKVKNGVFGAMMDVALVNDGPVTLIIDSHPQSKDSQETGSSQQSPSSSSSLME
jgi:D-tyrosyl-tRNA(Tyr) deacylase